VRIGVKEGSAYDLYLSRTLQQATVVRGSEGVDVFRDEGLEAAAGIRQPITRYVAEHPDLRLIDERFMQIQQAVGTAKSKRPETVAYLHDLIEDLKSSGFITASLAASGQADATVAPPA
jgi:polar amino acid transport system substrate-binding protein